MAQDLTVNIKTTSDVPQAMDRAKGATVSFGKQVDDIQKKFSMAFKDVFLSFLGPMALLGVAMNYIGKLIEENQRKHAEANQAAIDDTNELMSVEDKYWSRKNDREKKTAETVEQAKTRREDVTLEFLGKDPRAVKMVNERMGDFEGEDSPFYVMERMSRDKAIQDQVQAMIAQDLAKTGMIAKPGEAGAKATTFKGPEGFSNVVGVGANPVMEAMAEQTEIAKQQLAVLQQIANGSGVNQTDFTKNDPHVTGYNGQM